MTEGQVLDRLGAALYNAALGLSRTFRDSVEAQVAQLVEHAIENRSVAGSIPALGTITRSSSVQQNPQTLKKAH
jgi:hypothetical protein